MRTFSNKQKLAALVGAGVIVVAGGGIAFAFWSSSGSGTGSATTGTADNSLQITDATAITDLAPGVDAEPISGKIKNTSSTQNEYVNNVTVTIGVIDETAAGQSAATTTGHTCDANDYTLPTSTIMHVGLDLVPGQEVPFSGASIAFNDLPGINQDACQGATVHLNYTSN